MVARRMDRDDVGVTEPGDGLRLGLETTALARP